MKSSTASHHAATFRSFVVLLQGLCLALCVVGLSQAASNPADLIGTVAPNWQLTSIQGGRVELRQLQGKIVVLNFWATWCAPCRIEMQWLVELQTKHKSAQLVVLGVSMDDPENDEDVRSFATHHRANYPILLRGSSIAQSYAGVRYLPQTFFIDRDGTIVSATRGIRDKASLESKIDALLVRE